MVGRKFTDIFIERPVLATVVSLLLFFIGLRAIFDLPVRQFPKVENTLITISTSYPGANASLIEGFITTPIEKEVASADGIDYLTSSSIDGTSTIDAYIKLNFDPNDAFTSIMSKVAEVKNQLPTAAEDSVIQKQTGQTTALMYLGFNSTEMTGEQITDYLSRVVQPKLETVSGVSEAQLLGPQYYAMRIWLNTKRMAALGVSPNDIVNALQNNNFQAAAGSTKGVYVALPVNADTDVQTPEAFENIIIKQDGNTLVHLKDVAKVELGSQSYDSSVNFNGEKAVFIGIQAKPTANPLTVITAVKKVIPDIVKQFPPSLHEKIVYDSTKYITASIEEVIKTIAEAALIVIVVIFLFLGSLRTVTIPIVTIPLSLVGVFAAMLMLGYSINLLTLLSLVLAIGMVVDDAIVVVENIYRHIEDGLTPYDAAIQGAREIATPVISMTITLAAVYAPIGLMTGITGALFKEFAFTLAAAVIISGLIALTLSPMMCSKLLTADIGQQKLVHYIDAKFTALKNFYQRKLESILQYPSVIIMFAFVVLCSCFFLFVSSKAETAPTEDQGVVFVMATGPQTATLNYMETFTNEFNNVYKGIPSGEDYFIVNGFSGVSSVMSGFILKPWNERSVSQATVIKEVQQKLNNVAGLQVQAFPLPPLPVGGKGLPIDFEITTTRPFSEIYPVMEKMVTEAQNSGMFLYIDGGLRFNKNEVNLNINRSKAAQMGISMSTLAGALAGTLGGNYTNYFNMQGRSYEVIPQVQQPLRYNPKDLNLIHVKTANGTMVPLDTLASMSFENEPNSLTHFQQLNSTGLMGLMMPGYTIGEGLAYLQNLAQKDMPSGFSYNYGGQSRQFIQEGNALVYTFAFSIIVIFLVLSAQFESFRDPLVIMTSVPMAICGALLPINWGIATVNIYTQIGLITLIGLISKHGILMVDFAKNLRIANPEISAKKAIEEAAAIRLRPVLMTTAAMILGVVPLLIASGAGAASRFDIGLVISCGMAIGTLFTLFVVPTMYTLRARTILLLLLSVGVAVTLVYSFAGVITKIF
ncbi:MAG: efflux RND transporter permease subunit [Coxiellaceae bacterium]|nr:efflux RND transporter permease subunit [Coxiellaceae bacterium]